MKLTIIAPIRYLEDAFNLAYGGMLPEYSGPGKVEPGDSWGVPGKWICRVKQDGWEMKTLRGFKGMDNRGGYL